MTKVRLARFFRMFLFFFSSRRRHTRCSRDWSSDVCSSDLIAVRDASEVVVWLLPIDHPGTVGSVSEHSDKKWRVVQKNKSFQPHLTVVRVGSVVDFPNRDPFFHNVFSLFDGKRFDLGLYEAGATNSVRFDHAGVSFLFCNIHPEMSAAVIALDTPYYAVTDKSGGLAIPNVTDGKYDVQDRKSTRLNSSHGYISYAVFCLKTKTPA